jgi:hypothetical protein
MQLLREAQGALRGGDASTALSVLDRHEARFPHGVLSEERQAAQVVALCELGRIAEACERRRAFLATSPRSPQGGRVRAACAQQCAGVGE